MGIKKELSPIEVFEVDGHWYRLRLIDNCVHEILLDEAKTLCNEKNGSKNLEHEREVRWRNIRKTYKNIYALEMLVSQECNMECSYCYGQGNFGGSGLMSVSTAHQAIDWLQAAGAAKDIVISFYGGEPLLNYPVIRETVEYCQKVFGAGKVQFSITTNLTLLTEEMLDFFIKYHVGICVSFDGKAQDQNRRFKNGKSSYDMIMKKISSVLARKPDTLGRGTLYGDYSRMQMYEDLQAAGFTKMQVIAASGQILNDRQLPDKAEVYREQQKLYPLLTKHYITAVKNRDSQNVQEILLDSDFREAVAFGWPPRYNMMYCGCGRNLFAVDVKGDVYPCHRFVGCEDMRLGTIGKPFDELEKEIFDSHITFENASCKKCFLRFICGGSCMHESYCDAGACGEEKSVFKPFEDFCKYRRQVIKLAVHVWNILDDLDKSWVSQWNREV